LKFGRVFILQGKVVSLAPNPQPGGPGICMYVLQRQGGPVIPPETMTPFYRLSGLERSNSNPIPTGFFGSMEY
jgi:hypothetical protein